MSKPTDIICVTEVNQNKINMVAATAVLNNLFHPDGMIQHRLSDLISGKRIGKYYITLAFRMLDIKGKKKELVGIILYQVNKSIAMFYVKEGHRNRGIGTQMIQSLRTRIGHKVLNAYQGYGDYQHFFKKHHIFNLDEIYFSEEETAAILEKRTTPGQQIGKRRSALYQEIRKRAA